MKIKECAFCHNETLWGDNSEGTCNLLPQKDFGNIRFLDCEQIPISKCPYKLFMVGKIDKEELNKQIKELQNNARN